MHVTMRDQIAGRRIAKVVRLTKTCDQLRSDYNVQVCCAVPLPWLLCCACYLCPSRDGGSAHHLHCTGYRAEGVDGAEDGRAQQSRYEQQRQQRLRRVQLTCVSYGW